MQGLASISEFLPRLPILDGDGNGAGKTPERGKEEHSRKAWRHVDLGTMRFYSSHFPLDGMHHGSLYWCFPSSLLFLYKPPRYAHTAIESLVRPVMTCTPPLTTAATSPCGVLTQYHMQSDDLCSLLFDGLTPSQFRETNPTERPRGSISLPATSLHDSE